MHLVTMDHDRWLRGPGRRTGREGRLALELQARLVDSRAEPTIAEVVTPERTPSMYRRVINLAWPVIAQNLLETLVGVVDTILVARLGAAAIAGVGTALQVMFFLLSILSAVTIGASIMVAHAIGAGDKLGAQRVAKQAIVWGILGALPVAALGFAGASVM